MQPLQQRHQFRAGGVIADAERQLLPRRLFPRERAVMRFHQDPRMMQKRRAVGGQADRARRALDQPLGENAFQPLQLQADRGLRRPQRLGGAREAMQFGDQQEGLHGVDIERAHGVITIGYHCYKQR